MDSEKVINGLEFTKAMITFNPSTGEDIEPENLNEADKTTYDACLGAIALLKEQETVIRCEDCIHYRYYGLSEETVSECRIDHCENPDADWFCADGKRRIGDA